MRSGEAVRVARGLARSLGARGVILRASHELRRRGNRFCYAPSYIIRDGGLPLAAFRFDARSREHLVARERAIDRADRVCAGEFLAFGWQWRQLPASLEEWHRHPITGRSRDAGVPWWQIEHLDAEAGDIKDVWEPARFGWVYDLARAYHLTSDDHYARSFHSFFSTWRIANPPYRGVHWSCGQETAVRATALLYAEANLSGAPSSDTEAMTAVADVLAASAERIADGIGYAESQRNNHTISEAAGLAMLGTRFVGKHPDAEAWRQSGLRRLEAAVLEQFGDDGWYGQNSFNYARVALDQCILAQRVLLSAGHSLSSTVQDRLRRATEVFISVVDAATGEVPNRGANDGALVHPVSTSEFRDYRPVITLACATFGIACPADVPLDSEVVALLGLKHPAAKSVRRDGIDRGDNSGWIAVRNGAWAAFARAGRARFRPGHMDVLHLDLRWNGQEILVDPGTYSYNAPGGWREAFTSGLAHNGMVLDGDDRVVRGPRFLTLDAPNGRVVSADWSNEEAVFVIEIPDVARRTVRVTRTVVRVMDDALDFAANSAAVRWLLHPAADPSFVEAIGSKVLGPQTDNPSFGWFCPSYGNRIPSRCVVVERDLLGGRSMATTLSPPRSDNS